MGYEVEGVRPRCWPHKKMEWG